MAPRDNAILVYCLLGILLLVLLIVGAMGFLISYYRRRSDNSADAESQDEKPVVRPAHMQPLHFRTRQRESWLAVRQRDLKIVQEALALHDTKPCPWSAGLSREGEHTLFISPPVSGWILVIGPGLPDPAEDIDQCFRFLTVISRKLGHVQFFSANRVLNQHAWASLECGHVLRAYAWAGGTLWNEGKPTQAEQCLRMKCHAYGEPSEGHSFTASDAVMLNADKIHLLAARWSLDPDEIDESFIEHVWGLVGESSPRY